MTLVTGLDFNNTCGGLSTARTVDDVIFDVGAKERTVSADKAAFGSGDSDMTSRNNQVESDKLADDIASLREELATLATSVRALMDSQETRSPGGESAATDSDSTEEASDQWEDFQIKLGEARAQGEKAAQELAAEVEQHPLASVAIAFGIGFVVARVLGIGGRR